MSRDFEPKTGADDLIVDYDNVDPKLPEMQAELYKQAVLESLIGRCDDGLAEYWEWVGKAMDNRKTLGTGILKAETPTELPPKICNYRKPKVYWFGEAGNNINYSVGTGATHWAVTQGQIMHTKLEDYFAEYSDESLEISNSYEDDLFKRKRFIGISEATEQHWDMVDNDFLHRLTGDVWVETRTLNRSSKTWEPQGQIFIGGSKPLRINDKDKETLEH